MTFCNGECPSNFHQTLFFDADETQETRKATPIKLPTETRITPEVAATLSQVLRWGWHETGSELPQTTHNPSPTNEA